MLSSETDRVWHEWLRRDLLDDRVARVDYIDESDFVRNLGSDPVAGERYLREAEDAIGCREGIDGGPELFIVRRDLSVRILRPSAPAYAYACWRLTALTGEKSEKRHQRLRGRITRSANGCEAQRTRLKTCQLGPVLATARGPRDASEAWAIGTGTLASCC